MPSEDACPACGLSSVEFARVREDLANVESELRGKRSQLKRLKKAQSELTPEESGAVQVVLSHWKAVLAPGAKELNGARQEAVLARHRGGYTVEQLCRCADGYALKPYLVNGRRTHEGPKDARKVDAAFIYDNPQRVDQGLAIADQADALRGALAAKPSPRPQPPLSTALSALGEGAMRLGRALAVFPCREGQKTPATPHGFKNATRDLYRIRRWWEAHPADNIGLRTGIENGIVVLDIDVDDGKEQDGWWHLHRLEDQYGPMPETKSVRTPSGGLHLYFRHPGMEFRNTEAYPAPGLDIRGDGGYVVAPPSIVNAASYEVDDDSPLAALPNWLLHMRLDHQRRESLALNGSTDWARYVSTGAAQGERNGRMTKYVGHLIGLGMDAREAYATARVLNGNVRPPLSDRELQGIVKSIMDRHLRRVA
jgi:hypothetical protein